jgi:hypothetical protein
MSLSVFYLELVSVAVALMCNSSLCLFLFLLSLRREATVDTGDFFRFGFRRRGELFLEIFGVVFGVVSVFLFLFVVVFGIIVELSLDSRFPLILLLISFLSVLFLAGSVRSSYSGDEILIIPPQEGVC